MPTGKAMTSTPTEDTRLKPISESRKLLKKCPFCGSIPYIELGKKGHCQLHGEPFQSVTVYCKKHECAARPRVAAGDIYNGGEPKAKAEAIALWNTRTQSEPERWAAENPEAWEVLRMERPAVVPVMKTHISGHGQHSHSFDNSVFRLDKPFKSEVKEGL